MIIVKLDKTKEKYKTLYFNLKKEKVYRMEYNEYSETCVDVPMVWDDEEVKKLVLDEMEDIQEELKDLEDIIYHPNASYEDKSEYIRLNNNLKFLTHYRL